MYLSRRATFSNASKTILEALLFRFPDMRNIYDLLEIETVSSSEHPEVSNIISNFKNPAIVISIGVLANCYIIERATSTKYHYIEISNEVTYNYSNKGAMIDEIYFNIVNKDYVPKPLYRKVVFITDYHDGLEGIIYSKVKGGFILGNVDVNERDTRVLRKNPWQLIKEIVSKLEYEKK